MSLEESRDFGGVAGQRYSGRRRVPEVIMRANGEVWARESVALQIQ